MISPKDIVTHLRTYLPAFINDFSDKLTATASISGTTVTVNSTSHGVAAGQKLIVLGSQFENVLTDVTLNPDDTTRFTVGFDHDLTEMQGATVTLTGLGAPWDGTHNLLMVPNRRTFEIVTPSGASAPTLNASTFLVEERSAGVGGIQTVDTVIDANSFTIELSGDLPALPPGNIGDVEIMLGVRVYGAASIERAEELVTQYNDDKPRLFVIMTDLDVSKDRHSLNDATATFTPQNEQKLTMMQNFSTVCFIPTAQNDKSGFIAQRKAYKEICEALINVLYGFKYDDPFTIQNYVTVLNGHGPGRYNTAYYQHVYDWQLPAVINFEQGFDRQPDVAFRDISATWSVNEQDLEQLTANIDLDQEPL